MDLKLCLSTAASTKAMFCSQVATLRTDHSNARADFTSTCSSAALATSAERKMETYIERLKFWVTVWFSTVDDMHFQFAAAQPSILLASLELLRGERYRYLCLVCFLVVQSDRLDNYLTSSLTKARHSRFTLCCRSGTLLEAFCVRLVLFL